jgi:hypothetical protein
MKRHQPVFLRLAAPRPPNATPFRSDGLLRVLTGPLSNKPASGQTGPARRPGRRSGSTGSVGRTSRQDHAIAAYGVFGLAWANSAIPESAVLRRTRSAPAAHLKPKARSNPGSPKTKPNREPNPSPNPTRAQTELEARARTKPEPEPECQYVQGLQR